MPRLAPITDKSGIPAEHHPAVDAILKVFGRIRGPYSVLLHSPKVARQLLDLGSFFRDESVVPAKSRAVAILIAARERQSAYVWAAQVDAARRAGVHDNTLDLIRSRAAPERYPAEEREIVAYAEQLMRSNRADQPAFDALLKRYGAQGLVELTTVMNYYVALSGVTNAFEVEAPEGGDKLPD